jgi:hypothetical protein
MEALVFKYAQLLEQRRHPPYNLSKNQPRNVLISSFSDVLDDDS